MNDNSLTTALRVLVKPNDERLTLHQDVCFCHNPAPELARVEVRNERRGFLVFCLNCGVSGALATTADGAVVRWNTSLSSVAWLYEEDNV